MKFSSRAKARISSFVDQLPQEFLKSLRWQYVGNLGAGLLGGVYFLYLGRQLGLELFGLYAVSLSGATILFNLSDMRIHEALIHFTNAELGTNGRESAFETVKTLFLADITLRLVALLFILASSPIAAALLIKDTDSWYIVCCAGFSVFISKVWNTPSIGMLRLTERFDLTAKVLLADWSGRFALTAFLLSIYSPSPVLIFLVAAAVGGLMNLFLIAAALRAWRRRYGSAALGLPTQAYARLRKMWGFLTASQGINVLDTVVRDLDVAVVGLFATVPAAGLYRMVKNIAQLVWRAADPMFLVLMPIFSRMMLSGDFVSLKSFVKKVTLASIMLSICLVAGANIFAPLAITWFIPDFLPAVPLIPWMTFWVLLALPLIWTHPLAASAGRPDIQLRASLVGNLLGALLLFCLTPTLGITGAAIAWSTGLATTFAGGYVLLRRAKVI